MPQNAELAGYIRCFWGSERPYLDQEEEWGESNFIPDTCVDIIYYQLPQAEGSQRRAEGYRQSGVPSLRQMMIERNTGKGDREKFYEITSVFVVR